MIFSSYQKLNHLPTSWIVSNWRLSPHLRGNAARNKYFHIKNHIFHEISSAGLSSSMERKVVCIREFSQSNRQFLMDDDPGRNLFPLPVVLTAFNISNYRIVCDYSSATPIIALIQPKLSRSSDPLGSSLVFGQLFPCDFFLFSFLKKTFSPRLPVTLIIYIFSASHQKDESFPFPGHEAISFKHC
jgi:hypothetical protein